MTRGNGDQMESERSAEVECLLENVARMVHLV